MTERLLVILEEMGGARFALPALRKHSSDVKTVASATVASFLNNNGLQNVIIEPDENSLREIISRCRSRQLVIGTGALDGLCQSAMVLCQTLQVRFKSFVDHWTWFKERYTYADEWILPDKIAVIDDIAFQEAKRSGLPENRLIIVGHPHLEQLTIVPDGLKRRADAWRQNHQLEKEFIVGFVSEVYRDDYPVGSEHYPGFDEYEVYQDLEKAIEEMNHARKPALVVKPHPRECHNKYPIVPGEYPKIVFEGFDTRLFLEVCDTVVGMESMLLVEAAILGKTTISYLPRRDRDDDFIGRRLKLMKSCYSQRRLADALIEVTSSTPRSRFSGSTVALERFFYGE